MQFLHTSRTTARSSYSVSLAGLAFVFGLAACDDASSAPLPTSSLRSTNAAATANASKFASPSALPVTLDVFAPEDRHHVGQGGGGWLVDMEIEFDHTSLANTGFNGFQLSGPGGHANIAPFPKPAVLGRDESNPGLVVVCSTSTNGPGANLAGLFNMTGITDLTPSVSELWATWIVAAPACGVNTNTTMTIAIVADLNHDGIFNDAPNVVPDADGDGRITPADVKALGLASNIIVREFTINP